MQKAGEQGNGTLTITSAKKSDTATYTCEGKNDAGVDMDTVVLQVRGKLYYKVVITWLIEPAVRGFYIKCDSRELLPIHQLIHFQVL